MVTLQSRFIIALATLSTTWVSLPDIGVFSSKLMTIPAVSLFGICISVLARAICHVVIVRAEKQMIRADAQRIVTSMENP